MAFVVVVVQVIAAVCVVLVFVLAASSDDGGNVGCGVVVYAVVGAVAAAGSGVCGGCGRVYICCRLHSDSVCRRVW